MRSRVSFRAVASRLFFIIILLASPQLTIAQQGGEARAHSAPSSSLSILREKIGSLLDQPQFAAARWGVLVVSSNNDVVYERDADKAFTPASNMKLYTSAAALDALGPDFKIDTTVYASKAPAKGGILKGDLLLYGRGDTTLSARFDAGRNPLEFESADRIQAIESLADDIHRRGIRRIAGDVIGDDSYFVSDNLGIGWEWDDAQFYYGAEISALTINDNVVTFTVKPGRQSGLPPEITVQPQTSYMTVVNEATTVVTGTPRIGVHRPLNSNTVHFFGSIPQTAERFQVNIAVHDPARFAATLLKEALIRRGITVTGKVRRIDSIARMKEPFNPSTLVELAKVDSKPLSVMLRIVNKPSQNLHTELLLRQLGTVKGIPAIDDYGRPRSADALGNELRRQFLVRAGITLEPLSLRDGSGLARQNLVTPRATVRLLQYMRTHPYKEVFRDSLPIAGSDGTLERRMRDTVAAGNLRAKTGTLAYVNALSGYVTTRSGEVLVFSMFGNNYVGSSRDVTQVIDRICALLAEIDGETV
jgi:D-alanyl-D-alanine carboxypeptidase/D-alanyl-D-alanine-endopeptidase (penicillin-binding protein 4)